MEIELPYFVVIAAAPRGLISVGLLEFAFLVNCYFAVLLFGVHDGFCLRG